MLPEYFDGSVPPRVSCACQTDLGAINRLNTGCLTFFWLIRFWKNGAVLIALVVLKPIPMIPSIPVDSKRFGDCCLMRAKFCFGTDSPAMLTVSDAVVPEQNGVAAEPTPTPTPVPNLILHGLFVFENVLDRAELNFAPFPIQPSDARQAEEGIRRSVEPVSKVTILDIVSFLRGIYESPLMRRLSVGHKVTHKFCGGVPT